MYSNIRYKYNKIWLKKYIDINHINMKDLCKLLKCSLKSLELYFEESYDGYIDKNGKYIHSDKKISDSIRRKINNNIIDVVQKKAIEENEEYVLLNTGFNLNFTDINNLFYIGKNLINNNNGIQSEWEDDSIIIKNLCSKVEKYLNNFNINVLSISSNKRSTSFIFKSNIDDVKKLLKSFKIFKKVGLFFNDVYRYKYLPFTYCNYEGNDNICDMISYKNVDKSINCVCNLYQNINGLRIGGFYKYDVYNNDNIIINGNIYDKSLFKFFKYDDGDYIINGKSYFSIQSYMYYCNIGSSEIYIREELLMCEFENTSLYKFNSKDEAILIKKDNAYYEIESILIKDLHNINDDKDLLSKAEKIDIDVNYILINKDIKMEENK